MERGIKPKLLTIVLMLATWVSFSSCSPMPPEKYFGIAVLNCNLVHGFGGEVMYRELERPSVKMVGNDVNRSEPMKRKEIVDDKIRYAEENYEKVKELKQTEDNKNMIQASLALYEYILPVYKNEYRQLAKLYDEGASRESIESYAQAISDKYYARFEELYNNVAAAGKPYAEKHGIKVNWDVRTSPR